MTLDIRSWFTYLSCLWFLSLPVRTQSSGSKRFLFYWFFPENLEQCLHKSRCSRIYMWMSKCHRFDNKNKCRKIATLLEFSVQFSSVAQSCPTLCDPMNRSTPGLPVHHQCPEFTQTHVHRVSNAIQPSHPLPSPSPPTPNPSQHQSFPVSQLFAWGGQSTGVSALASFLPKNTQGWSPSEWTGWMSLQSKGLSRVFSNTTVQKHQFFDAQLSSQSNSHIHTWPLDKP